MVILGGAFWHASGCPPRANLSLLAKLLQKLPPKKNTFSQKKV
jgi:hypothetical protein